MRNFINNLIISFQIAKLNFKLRNEGTWLGVLWYFLNPLFVFMVLNAVFSTNIGTGIEKYPWFILIGIVVWNFFSNATTEGGSTFNSYSGIMQKLPLSKEYLLVSSVITSLYNFIIEFTVLLVVYVAFGNKLSLLVLYLIPLLVLLAIITISLTFVLSLVFSRFKDFINIWKLLLFVCWFLTPIFYNIDLIKSPSVSFIMNINPMTHMLNIFRDIILYNRVDFHYILLFLAAIVPFYAICYLIFKRFSKNVVDYL